MTTQRIDPRRGFVNPEILPRGPGGRALCRECKAEVPRGRQTFCGPACVEAWKVRTQPGHVRHLLFLREHGVCGVCGIDTVATATALVPAGWPPPSGWPVRPRGWLQMRDYMARTKAEDRDRFREFMGAEFPARELNRFWDADHVVPVIEGGGGCGLDNYRTLCIPCHRLETAALCRKRAAERREGGR